jgi:pimeloyl-ACP methyl ester carboxylesterase
LLFERDGVRLAGLDFGGDGLAVLLLHGLAGYAGEWNETAGWLRRSCRVVALDARGHGESERFPRDVSRAAYVSDAVFAVEELGLSRAVVVGQSLGGQAAILLAAERPDLVCGLVVADASPAGGGEADALDATAEAVGDSLRQWPVPFASRAAAIEFFGGPSLKAEAWADGLEQRQDGLWPRFDVGVMVRTLREAVDRSYWDEWESISCPVMVVRAGNGVVPAADAQAMIDRLPHVDMLELPDAEHDLHLDRPSEWRAALSQFLTILKWQRQAPSGRRWG